MYPGVLRMSRWDRGDQLWPGVLGMSRCHTRGWQGVVGTSVTSCDQVCRGCPGVCRCVGDSCVQVLETGVPRRVRDRCVQVCPGVSRCVRDRCEQELGVPESTGNYWGYWGLLGELGHNGSTGSYWGELGVTGGTGVHWVNWEILGFTGVNWELLGALGEL